MVDSSCFFLLSFFMFYFLSLLASYILKRFSLSAFVTTQKLDKLMAAAPNIGFSFSQIMDTRYLRQWDSNDIVRRMPRTDFHECSEVLHGSCGWLPARHLGGSSSVPHLPRQWQCLFRLRLQFPYLLFCKCRCIVDTVTDHSNLSFLS